jgi:hypothetical protein
MKDNNISTVNVTGFNEHRHYVLFYFDKQDSITRTELKGVDLTEKKKSSGKTVALAVSLSTAFAVMISAWLLVSLSD